MPANLEQFSDALAAHAAAVRGAVAAIRLSERRHLTGTLWQPDVLVASEQSLPKRDEFELIVAGGSVVNAKLAGRDPGTNIAVLRLTSAVDAPTLMNGEVNAGALALAFGADGAGGVSVRLGVVNLAGPEWASSAGGRIDRYIVLDLRLARAEDGGPVLDAAGGRLGITTFGPRAKVLVIPAATIERIVPALLQGGHRRGRHRPDGQRHAHAQPAQDRHASRLRQHRPQGRAAGDPGRNGPFAAGYRRSAARRMSAVAVQRVAARRLRISIRAEDPALLAELRRIIVEAGHDVVDAPEEADVLMHDARGDALAGFAALKETEFRALLTPREIEVLGAIGEGLTNKAIARRLDISPHTVKFHLESLFRKLGARTRTEAVAKASERQLDV